jgi:hypothetical protein
MEPRAAIIGGLEKNINENVFFDVIPQLRGMKSVDPPGMSSKILSSR